MPAKKKVKKIFVLDTSIPLYNSGAVKNVEKHHIALEKGERSELANLASKFL